MVIVLMSIDADGEKTASITYAQFRELGRRRRRHPGDRADATGADRVEIGGKLEHRPSCTSPHRPAANSATRTREKALDKRREVPRRLGHARHDRRLRTCKSEMAELGRIAAAKLKQKESDPPASDLPVHDRAVASHRPVLLVLHLPPHASGGRRRRRALVRPQPREDVHARDGQRHVRRTSRACDEAKEELQARSSSSSVARRSSSASAVAFRAA